MMKSKIFFVIVALQLITIGLFAGVRQMRTATPTGGGQTTYVNPSYSNRATTYRQQTGNTGLTPGQAAAVAGRAGYVTYNGYETPVVGEYYDNYDGYVETSAPGSNIPLGTVLEYVPSSAVPIMVDGARYYYENNIYFAEVFNGNAVVYQVVDAPLGAVVTQLPAGCVVQNYNGRSFQQCGYTYYQQVAGGYQVVLLN
jgi:hypothetical protein